MLFGAGDTSDSVNDVNLALPTTDIPIGRQVITTWGQAELSAVPLLEHADTEAITSGEFYKNSADPDQYEIYYDEPSGSISVLLANNPLSLARNLAELQLQQVLGLRPDRLCELQIRVAVNAAVNEQYARTDNLGLSFCPGAVQFTN
jgi:hypothetical protein